MPPHQTNSRSTIDLDLEAGTAGTVDVLLTAGGKTWGRLLAGNILEIRRGETKVCFDLSATAASGRPVACQACGAGHPPSGECLIYCKMRTSVLE